MPEFLNPFRLPVHPPLVHFPIALLTLTWVFLVIRYATGDVRWDERARLLHLIGVASLPVVIVAALIDTRGFGFLSPPRWDAPLVWHALAGVLATGIFVAHYLWRRRQRAEQLVGRRAAFDLSAATLGVWVLIAVGLIAGEMVFGA